MKISHPNAQISLVQYVKINKVDYSDLEINKRNRSSNGAIDEKRCLLILSNY